MNHQEIETQNVAERYVLRTLPPEESARFEEHFVDCPHCQDRLEAVERFRAALKPLAAAGAARAESGQLSRAGWSRPAWLLAASLVLAAGLAFLFYSRVTLQRELERTRSASLDWRKRYEAERDTAESLRRPAPPQPLVGPTFYLTTARSAESDTSEPVNRITLPPGLSWVILSFGGKIDPGFRSLRASLKDSSGRVVWEQDALPAISQEPLSVALPSALLRSGVYVIDLQGLSSDGRYLAAGVYRLRVLPR